MKNILTKFAAGVVLTCTFSGANANIIVNGGFDQGLSNWSCVGADYCTTAADGGFPGSTMKGFDNNGYTSLSQTVATQIGATYQLSFYSKAYAVAGNEIGYSFGGFEKVVWVPTTLEFAQSVGNFKAVGANSKVEFFLATNPGTGLFYIDTVSLEKIRGEVPEPGSLALFGLGLAGFAAFRRTRKG